MKSKKYKKNYYTASSRNTCFLVIHCQILLTVKALSLFVGHINLAKASWSLISRLFTQGWFHNRLKTIPFQTLPISTDFGSHQNLIIIICALWCHTMVWSFTWLSVFVEDVATDHTVNTYLVNNWLKFPSPWICCYPLLMKPLKMRII